MVDLHLFVLVLYLFTFRLYFSFQIHHKLSLCAAENGQENLAMVEGERALKIFKETCGPTDRALAEAYFNFGSLCFVYGMLLDAADNMKMAVSLLENCKGQFLC